MERYDKVDPDEIIEKLEGIIRHLQRKRELEEIDNEKKLSDSL